MAKANATPAKRTRATLTDEQRAEKRRAMEKKFVELVQKRMTNALKRLSQLETLGKYPHTEDQNRAIFKALDDAVATVKRALSSREQKTFAGFVLTPFDAKPDSGM